MALTPLSLTFEQGMVLGGLVVSAISLIIVPIVLKRMDRKKDQSAKQPDVETGLVINTDQIRQQGMLIKHIETLQEDLDEERDLRKQAEARLKEYEQRDAAPQP